MKSPQDELEALKTQVAALTARVFRLEQASGASSGPRQEPVPQPQQQRPDSPLAGTMLDPPSPQIGTGPRPTPTPFLQQPLTQSQPNLFSASPREDAGLEKQIGQFWLNRIGIVALLFGVSYFLKYAFENNWIGPAGRVVIGLSLWGAFQVYHPIPAAAASARNDYRLKVGRCIKSV